MGKVLIIAEKPSVATDIARVLGGFVKHTDYYESEEYVLSSAVGHLLELAVPEKYEVKRGKWSFANLPVIPPHFDLNPIEKTKPRLKLLKKLIKRKDVDKLINAAMQTEACLCIIPLQDYLHLGTAARMNTPGTITGNWLWTFNWDQLTEEMTGSMRQQITEANRLVGKNG